MTTKWYMLKVGMNIDFFSAALVKTYLYAGITLLIAVLADSILRSLIKVPKHFDNRRARNAATITKNLITIIIYIVAVYIVLTILGVNLTPLLASASVIGIILGIGARSIIEDFVTGLFLLSLDSIAIGDYVQIGTTEGTVEQIGARTLKVRSETGAVHVIPNSMIKELINYSRHKANILIDVPVKTDQAIAKVTKAATEALAQLQKDPEYADSLFSTSQVNGIESFIHPETMTLRITLTTYPVRRWEVGRQYRVLLKKEFEKNKIKFA